MSPQTKPQIKAKNKFDLFQVYTQEQACPKAMNKKKDSNKKSRDLKESKNGRLT